MLALGSLLFYWLGAGTGALLVLVALILVNFARGAADRDAHGDERRAWLIPRARVRWAVSFISSTWLVSGKSGQTDEYRLFLFRVALPLGVSFYVFQSIAYVADVYRGDAEAERSLFGLRRLSGDVPQLVWGSHPAPARCERGASHEASLLPRGGRERLFAFVVGLGCKVVLADQLASLWTALERIGFAYLSAPLAWFGAVGYSLQLYYDFAGYSLMAMGLARMLGFVIPRNFDLPYCSRSISEFWRRWHITLGIWFRDYLYIPLGGSRNGKRRLLLSLFVVWTLTGLWHGAAWNFVLWGLVLFVFIALESSASAAFLERHRFLSRLYFLFLIPQTWVVFRISDLGELGTTSPVSIPSSAAARACLPAISCASWKATGGSLLSAFSSPRRGRAASMKNTARRRSSGCRCSRCSGCVSISSQTGTGNPFLYARF